MRKEVTVLGVRVRAVLYEAQEYFARYEHLFDDGTGLLLVASNRSSMSHQEVTEQPSHQSSHQPVIGQSSEESSRS